MKIEDSCKLAGYSESAYHYWRARGRKDREKNRKTIFSRFLESTDKARLEWKKTHIQNINTAAKKDWKASCWLLSHQFPEEFGKKALEVELPEDLQIKIVTDINKIKK